jgi:hypothetical protein
MGEEFLDMPDPEVGDRQLMRIPEVDQVKMCLALNLLKAFRWNNGKLRQVLRMSVKEVEAVRSVELKPILPNGHRCEFCDKTTAAGLMGIRLF